MSISNSQNHTDNGTTVSPVRLFPHDNPCPNPQLPPLKIGLDNTYIPQLGDWDRKFCLVAVIAYWKQATNMTQLDQNEYLSLIKASYFKMNRGTERGPSHHPLYSKLQNEPTWAKFVFLSALYPEILVIKGQPTPFQQQMISAFKSLHIEDNTQSYRLYKSNPQRNVDQDKVLSSSSSGAHPDLLNAILAMQNAIIKQGEKLDAIREEMRQQREQREQREKTMLIMLDQKLDAATKEMTEMFKKEGERMLQLYSRKVSEVVNVARNNDMTAIKSENASTASAMMNRR